MVPVRGGDRKMGWAQEHSLTHLLAGWLVVPQSKVRSNDRREGKADSLPQASWQHWQRTETSGTPGQGRGLCFCGR